MEWKNINSIKRSFNLWKCIDPSPRDMKIETYHKHNRNTHDILYAHGNFKTRNKITLLLQPQHIREIYSTRRLIDLIFVVRNLSIVFNLVRCFILRLHIQFFCLYMVRSRTRISNRQYTVLISLCASFTLQIKRFTDLVSKTQEKFDRRLLLFIIAKQTRCLRECCSVSVIIVHDEIVYIHMSKKENTLVSRTYLRLSESKSVLYIYELTHE